MSYSLNLCKGLIYGMKQGSIIEAIKGDTRSLDYDSYYVPLNPSEWPKIATSPLLLLAGIRMLIEISWARFKGSILGVRDSSLWLGFRVFEV